MGGIKGFKQRKDLLRCTYCCVRNGSEGSKRGQSGMSPECMAVVQVGDEVVWRAVAVR